ncbi:hypothetical protein FQR65_LT00581 [Abscondita terminalis]|nr:hypothetical protein FQR65_LT00581 [Abscondita terminalis]
MGDSSEDINFMSIQHIGVNDDQGDCEEKIILNSSEDLCNNDLTGMDDIEGPTQEKVVENEEKQENILNANEEGNVESPTTGELFIYKCVFCERNLTAVDEPRLLECLHNACSSCINNKIYEHSLGNPNTKGHIECAACSLMCDPDKLIENQFLLEFTVSDDNSGKVTEIKCSSCSDDAVAVSFCIDCSEYICDSCVQAHQRLKITKDHTIKPKDEGFAENQAGSNGSSSQTLHCNVHPHEKLSLFCENCDKLTCRDCQLIEHRDHKYKFTHEIAADTRTYISSMLKDVSYKRVLLNSAMKVIDDRQSLIADKKQALVKEITQLVVKLTNTINVRGKQLISRLSEVCEQKQKTLQEKKVALDQLSKMTDYCIEFTQHALENGSDMALLYSKRQVTMHLQRIKCKRADIPNPEIPVRIHLALDKVPDLIKVISTIGQIVVDGRVYPTTSTSPAAIMSPHGSPSPGHSRPPQQQSPLNQQIQPPPQQPSHPPPSLQQMPPQQMQQHHQQQQMQQHSQLQTHQHTSSSGFQPPRIPPPYSQYSQQQMATNPNMGQKMSPIPGPNISQLMPAVPISLAQQLQQNMPKMPLQRSPNMVRSILPMNRLPNAGLNHQQQQVSSSTHPQGLMHERANLRGLLQPNGNAVYVQTGPNQYQAVQPQFAQQFQTRYSATQQLQQFQRQQQTGLMPQNQPYRMPLQRMSGPNHSMQATPPVSNAKWHIPQQQSNVPENIGNQLNTNVTVNRVQILPGLNDNFKITLKQQTQIDTKPATVSSTIPKTPSPNHIQGKLDTERNLDKYCQDSVNDLMATIAKLDSNGVQVLAEGRSKTGDSPHVDSSTDDINRQTKTDTSETGKDDPNEDWCAVCMDGGELVCCDKCPKVFHQFCHIPNLSVEESDTWQCLLCMNFADIPDIPVGERKGNELTPKERKIAERLILELYCQYEQSLPFREIIGLENAEYHTIIKKPIALDSIRHKLDWTSEDCYTHIEELVQDVRLMFKNAYTYNEEGTQVFNDAKQLEKFFDEQLEKFLPQYAYENFDHDDDIQPPAKKYRRIISD